jgi:hypothetical protein
MDGPDPIPHKKYLFDTPAIKAPRKNMNLQPILNNHGLSIETVRFNLFINLIAISTVLSRRFRFI